MRWVKIRHPGTGGEAEIAESALPQHLLAGWELAEDEDQDQAGKPAQAAAMPEAGAGQAGEGDKTSRSRAGASNHRGE